MTAIARKRITLEYPVHNSLLLPLEYLERRIEVIDERSIADVPITLEAFLKAPFRRRGITLLRAIDLDEGQERKFYRECAKDGSEPGLQFVLVDTEEPGDFAEPVGRVFYPTVRDRQRMLDVLPLLDPIPAGLSLAVRGVPLE